MTLADYYGADPRLVLIPIEHLSPAGMSREIAVWLRERGWSAARTDLFDRSFALYWTRGAALARRARTWMPPRVRHVAVVEEPDAVRPYAQLLNTSAWTLYATDLDPDASHPELVAYLLAHGDRMALARDVSLAGLHNAAWWIERTDDECAAFAAAAARSSRPDAAAFRALADALPWLRRLRHETIDPPRIVSPHRGIPGTGLLVPQAFEHEPRGLVDATASAARAAVAAYRDRWRSSPRDAITALCGWLADDAPPLIVTAGREPLWEPRQPERIDALRNALESADAVAVAAIGDDLRTIARHTRTFLGALVDAARLPMPSVDTEQRGYAWMHREHRLIAYDLDEPGMERRFGPGLPYARAMLGARTIHEWAHLAADAGWVPCAVTQAELDDRGERLVEALRRVIAGLPSALRTLTARDLLDVGSGEDPAHGLARAFLTRIGDYQANLLAQRFLDRPEIETYVRQNVRTLRLDYPPAQLFRMLIRYLFELQYLAFSRIEDAATFFVRSTWFDADYFATGILSPAMFSELARAAGAICTSYAVDESCFTRRAS